MIMRTANENDFDRVHELMYQIFEKHLLRRPDVYKQGEVYTLEQYKKALTNKNEIIILAESEKMVVGLCHMVKIEFKENPIMRQDCIAFIEDFCVDRDYQRCGIGKALYKEAVKKSEAWQADSIELNVWKMNRLKLVLPAPEYKEQLLDYKREFIENGDSMDGTAGLSNTETFEEWYSTFCDNLKEETVRKGLVPATTYMAISIDDGRLIGMIDIRHRLNDYLLNFGGHIGYSIRKSKRQQGYAIEMLGLALKECVKLKIKKVLITCDKDNIASAKTIINNGAKLENEVPEGNRITQRYWITLD